MGTWQPSAQGSELGKILPAVRLLLPKEMCVPVQLQRAERRGHLGKGPPQAM